MYFQSDFVQLPDLGIECTPENASAFFAVTDLNSQKSFTKNFGGYPRSDIAIINDEQNEEVALQFMANLAERASDGFVDADDAALLASHRSRYCQTPSEMVSFVENILSQRDEKRLAKADDEEKAKIEKERDERRRLLLDSLSSSERDDVNAAKRRAKLSELIFES